MLSRLMLGQPMKKALCTIFKAIQLYSCDPSTFVQDDAASATRRFPSSSLSPSVVAASKGLHMPFRAVMPDCQYWIHSLVSCGRRVLSMAREGPEVYPVCAVAEGAVALASAEGCTAKWVAERLKEQVVWTGWDDQWRSRRGES